MRLIYPFIAWILAIPNGGDCAVAVIGSFPSHAIVSEIHRSPVDLNRTEPVLVSLKPTDTAPIKDPLLEGLDEQDQRLDDDSKGGKAAPSGFLAPLVRAPFGAGLPARASVLRNETRGRDQSTRLRC